MLDSPGNPFWDPDADASCFKALRDNLRARIPLIEVNANINDAAFASRAAETLLDMLKDHT
jgi:uncharacterized protein (UPF0261 family)